MSKPFKPPAGYYYIANSAKDFNYGSHLAVTNDVDALDVSSFNVTTPKPTQEWYIVDYDENTQSISPANDSTLQVCFKSQNELTTCSSGSYVWAIRGSYDAEDLELTYTIQDGGQTVFWGLQVPQLASPIWVANDSSYQDWKLIPSR